jgi:hypothetical protein
MVSPFGGGQTYTLSSQYSRLVNMPTVQKELEIVDDQKTKITEQLTKMRSSMMEIFSGMQDVDPEQRQAKMEEIGKKMQAQQDDVRKAIEKILLPNQVKRLKEIALQMAGTQAINDKQIQDELKLTSEQKDKIKKIGEDSTKKIRALFEEGGDPQDSFPKMQDMRKDTEKQTLNVLTDAQKTALEKMKGKKLEIPESEQFGGFGGGPGGGGPGGGGPGGGN